MLIVITIISILGALLMPALRKALAESRKISCMNNARQQFMALGMYFDTYRDTFPSANYDNSSNSISPESVFSRRFYEDGFLTYENTSSGAYVPTLRCPASPYTLRDRVIHYGGCGGTRPWPGVNDKGVMAQNGYGTCVRLARVRAPSETLAIACSWKYNAKGVVNGSTCGSSNRGHGYYPLSESYLPASQYNHAQTIVLLFVDGHVQSVGYVFAEWARWKK